MNNWYVYIVECSDGSFYTGISTDTERRLREHNQGRLGAKYTRARRPVKLVYQQSCEDRAAAGKSEYRIRKLTRIKKLQLITSYNQS